MRSFGERLLHRGGVARFPFKAQVARNVRVQLRCSRRERVLESDGRAQIAEFDLDGIERVLRRQRRLRHHHGACLAHEAHPVGGKRRPRRLQYLRVIAPREGQ